MPYQPNDLLSRHFQESGHDLTGKVEEQLNLVSPNSPNIPIYRDMLSGLLGQLAAVAPVLKLPGQRRRTCGQQHHAH